eukprot:scaffold34975_cov17-Tisochrysis_lutea.AAC.2
MANNAGAPLNLGTMQVRLWSQEHRRYFPEHAASKQRTEHPTSRDGRLSKANEAQSLSTGASLSTLLSNLTAEQALKWLTKHRM